METASSSSSYMLKPPREASRSSSSLSSRLPRIENLRDKHLPRRQIPLLRGTVLERLANMSFSILSQAILSLSTEVCKPLSQLADQMDRKPTSMNLVFSSKRFVRKLSTHSLYSSSVETLWTLRLKSNSLCSNGRRRLCSLA